MLPFNQFDIPDIPSMPGPFPDNKCCSKDALQSELNNVEKHIKGMMGGSPPEGVVVAATGMAFSCYKGICTPAASAPSAWQFGNYKADKCVNYCINFHEWVHFSDLRPWDESWSWQQVEIFHEFPAYVAEKACLLQMKEKAGKP
jgi:hypothetical protein